MTEITARIDGIIVKEGDKNCNHLLELDHYGIRVVGRCVGCGLKILTNNFPGNSNMDFSDFKPKSGAYYPEVIKEARR